MQGIYRFARCLAFAALVARALVPMGWMPDAHGLTICSLDSHKVPAQDGQSRHDNSHDACPFAAAPHLAATPDLPRLAAPSVHALATATKRFYAAAILAPFAPQSPRAPPLNA